MSYLKYQGKNVYYDEIGEGKDTIVFLHGNTASSKMFRSIINYFQDDYKIILIDFLGCGESDRVDCLDIDLWYDESMQVIKLLEERKYTNVNLIGTSGGAIVAINIALERPDLINKVIADSFEGEEALEIVANTMSNERENSKKDQNAVMFYKMMNGIDWEKVVDSDTKAIVEHAKKIKKFYHKELTNLTVPVLFTGSQEDEFLALLGKDFYKETFEKMINQVKDGRMHLFIKGGHPALISNEKEFVDLSKEFLNNRK